MLRSIGHLVRLIRPRMSIVGVRAWHSAARPTSLLSMPPTSSALAARLRTLAAFGGWLPIADALTRLMRSTGAVEPDAKAALALAVGRGWLVPSAHRLDGALVWGVRRPRR